LGVAVSNTSKEEDFKMFKLKEADFEWRTKNLDVNCKEAFNAAHVELLSLPQSSLLKEGVKEVIVAAATKGEVELFCQSGSTDKFKFLLADFVKCLLLGVRSILEEDACSDLVFSNVASFMKSFQAGGVQSPHWNFRASFCQNADVAFGLLRDSVSCRRKVCR
jgi:hypothetical protein